MCERERDRERVGEKVRFQFDKVTLNISMNRKSVALVALVSKCKVFF